MKKLMRFTKGYRLFVVLAPLLMVLEVCMDLLQPTLMSEIVDIGVANGDIGYILRRGGVMLLCALLGAVGGMGCTVASSVAGMGFGTNMRTAIYDKVQSFSFRELDQLKTSSLITRITNDVTQIQNMFMMALRMLVRAPLLLFGGMFMALRISPRLSLIFLASMPVLLIGAAVVMKKAFPLFGVMQERIDRVNTVMRENLLGVRVIKAFAGQEREKTRFGKANEALKEQSLRAMYLTVGLMPLVTLIMNLSVIALFWFGGNMAISGTLSNGNLMAFLSYLTQVLSSLMMVTMMTINFTRAKACADRINEVFDTRTTIGEPDAPKTPQGYDVVFDHVSFQYNAADPESVLKDISFDAKPGQTIGIIGGTGSGKSTLVSLIPRLYDATQGQVRIGGVDVRQIGLEQLRAMVGVVLQESLLFSGTVGENLRWGNPQAPDEVLYQALSDAQGLEFIQSRQDGLRAEVEQRAKNFSGGQKQRLSIARAFVKQPKILILDDSTSAVDTATEAKIQQALSARDSDSIVFIIAQRISAISRADKILVLDDGRLEAAGTHEQLLKSCEIYRSIAVSQLGQEVLDHV